MAASVAASTRRPIGPAAAAAETPRRTLLLSTLSSPSRDWKTITTSADSTPICGPRLAPPRATKMGALHPVPFAGVLGRGAPGGGVGLAPMLLRQVAMPLP